jgi:5-methylcytosine-specific restriction endonuclease McrA
MPMQRDLYPPDWEAIAQRIKEDAQWQCQECGRACRCTGETLAAFCQRTGQTLEEVLKHPQRYTLSVAHLDQNPQNGDRANLKALCTGCHLRHDTPFRPMNRYAKRERRGQLRIEGT